MFLVSDTCIFMKNHSIHFICYGIIGYRNPVITLPRYYIKYHRIGMMSSTLILDDAIKWEIVQVILVRVWIGMLTFSGENTKPQVKI